MGFAAETDQIEKNAREKLDKKRLDFLFVNAVARVGESLQTGFWTDTNAGVFLTRDSSRPLGLTTKRDLSRAIWDQLPHRGPS